jgi:hypothetical protein
MAAQLQEEQRAAQIAQATAAAAAAGAAARMTTRTITSSIPGAEDGQDEDWRDAEGTIGAGGRVAAGGSSSSRSRSSKAVSAKVFASHIDKVLDDESVREDFVDIVRDLEDRAMSYTKKHVSWCFIYVL